MYPQAGSGARRISSGARRSTSGDTAALACPQGATDTPLRGSKERALARPHLACCARESPRPNGGPLDGGSLPRVVRLEEHLWLLPAPGAWSGYRQPTTTRGTCRVSWSWRLGYTAGDSTTVPRSV